MVISKKELLKNLQKDWKKYWDLKVLKELGFQRQECKGCGKWFWAQEKQDLCNDSSCRPYEFLGKQLTNKKYDFFKTWDVIKRFFVKEGHAPLERYPVLCRWYPLYFTIAGIVDFYRLDGKKLKFEFPENPSILTQPCLRFADIPQVGISGRHFTCFNMIQQSALWDGKNGYWKDRTIELDYNLLTKVFDINPNEINFLEDVWVGAGALGYSLEYHIAGLEVGNAVFTEFEGTPDKFTEMKDKVVDMGAGHERFCWLSHGTPTAYDAVFGNLIDKIRKKSGLEYDKKFFLEYSKLAGKLNADEADVRTARAEISKILGVSPDELNKKVAPMEAVYSILDHSRTLAFALSDGGLPSNVGGGYNLRVILRRALNFIEKYNFPFDLEWSIEEVSKFFKPMYPELTENFDKKFNIIKIEKSRHKNSADRGRKFIEDIINKKVDLNEKKLIELYDSHGVSPETILEFAEKNKINVNVPPDFYSKITEKHMKNMPEEREKLDVLGLDPTEKTFYKDMLKTELKSKVIKILNKNIVVLDKTIFYPRGGGQEPDFGTINGARVYDVESIDGVVLHYVDDLNFKDGDTVLGKIDSNRRRRITIHHDATHVINEAARRVLGPWVWQGGSKKDSDKAHIDVDHYKPLEKKEVEEIEKMANEIAKKNLKIIKKEYARRDAEKKFGFVIYQGAAVPSDKLRIVDIGGFDIEACGGTHGDNTKDLFPIVITKVERPADGTVRFVYKAGPAAIEYLESTGKILKDAAKLLGCSEADVSVKYAKLIEKWKEKRKELEKLRESSAEKEIDRVEFENIKGIRVLVKAFEGKGSKELQEISAKLSSDDTILILFGVSDKIYVFGSVGEKAAKSGVDAGKIVAEVCKELGGRGGGRTNLAQGVGTEKEKIKDAIEKARSMI